jgi:hypothetical protein
MATFYNAQRSSICLGNFGQRFEAATVRSAPGWKKLILPDFAQNQSNQ